MDADPSMLSETDLPVDPLRLDVQLCFALYSASNLLTRMYRAYLAPMGLTYPQYVALLALWETSPQTVGELCRRLTLDSGTLSPLFRRLEAMGVVRRERDVGDHRRVLIHLTSKGRAMREQALEIPRKLACEFPISMEEAVALQVALSRLADGLQSQAADPE